MDILFHTFQKIIHIDNHFNSKLLFNNIMFTYAEIFHEKDMAYKFVLLYLSTAQQHRTHTAPATTAQPKLNPKQKSHTEKSFPNLVESNQLWIVIYTFH